MKRTLLLFAIATVATLCACSKDAATVDESQPARSESTEAELQTPLTFAQTRQIVADVLGDAVAATITPTSRYLKFTFDSTEQMLAELSRGEIEYLPAPMFGEQVEEVTTNEDQPKPMYALVDSNVSLPEGVKCDVLAESFDPRSPLSGLSDEQADRVAQAMMPEMTRAAANWTPSGRIEIRDELTNEYIAVANVPVIVTGYKAGSSAIMQSETCITNSEGRFTCTKQFYGFVSEQVKWSTTYFNILSTTADIAYTNSPALDQKAWNLVLSSSTTDRRAYQYATAYRAANYMHKNGYALRNLINSKYSTLNIACLDQVVPTNVDDEFAPDMNDPTIAQVTIYCKNKSGLDIYNTVHREAGKAVHYLRSYAKSTTDYAGFSKTIIDSWGEFTKYYFAEKEYETMEALDKLHTYTSQYPAFTPYPAAKPDELNLQGWMYDPTVSPTATVHRRTPLFIDLYDDFNQKTFPGRLNSFYGEYPSDNFSRQNFSEYVTWSQNCKTISSLKTTVVNKVKDDATQKSNAENLFTIYLELESRQNQ